MRAPERISSAAQTRIADAAQEISRSMEAIRAGRPLDAEPDPQRKLTRIATVAGVSLETAARIAGQEEAASLGLGGESLSRAEAIQGKTVDYLGVAWLDAGRVASKAVARILFAGGGPNGTGFLVSDRLLLTNNHVIPDRASALGMMVEFRYEVGLGERQPSPVRFALDPGAFFETDDQDDLDYTLVALGRPLTPGAALAEFGRCPLSASAAKHLISEQVNIVQHPDGDVKQVVVRENRIVHRGETVLHYLADTEPGASGSPVFNDQWHVVALHHWGSPHREEVSSTGRSLSRSVNEGIRISAIVKELEERASRMNANQRAMLREALNAPPASDFGSRMAQGPVSPGPQAILPVYTEPELPPVSRQAEAAGAPASWIDRNYTNRRGYNPRFLSGFVVPMPQLNARQRASAARVSGIGLNGNPFELKYQHFSVVLNGERRMPFFSICNIDGANHFRIDRDTGAVISGPEATEVWAVDERVPAEAQLNDAFYRRLRDAFRVDNRSDFFARGHMTRREDPNWGTAVTAKRANADTYHHPNACPQVNKAFNASQKFWQGIENYVLGSTDAGDVRATVITGPVFTPDDPVFEDQELGGILLPQRFWKIVAFVEDGERKVFALLADQSEATVKVMAQVGGQREALFQLPSKLRMFKSTVAEITELTGLDFGDLASHDVFADGGESLAAREVTSEAALVPRRATDGAFGEFASIGDFLEKWEESQRPEAAEEEPREEGAERRRRRKEPSRPKPPQARHRRVVEVEAEVRRVFADDLSGAKHQQFSVVVKTLLAADAKVKAGVQTTLDQEAEVRLAVRFGDSRGLEDRIPGIRSGLTLHIKGEWIPAEEAYAVKGERLAVLHFTHDPLGFVCTPVRCYS